ncbi:MAG: bifunctional copper resistance protein CopD/cytochrome c oxidase assembly protein [Candidatus Planktophila sp.]|jgi:putative copper resistance protein D|nr:bifunctional copper resistance protein CopD/cytochrome c oxidase assembly protein [Candidatus Planktophila sp.]
MIALELFSKYLSLIASFSTIGTLLTMAFLLLDSEGRLSTQAQKLRRLLWASALAWSLGAFGTIVSAVAELLEKPISDAFDATTLRSFITQVTLGQYLFFQTLVALLVAALAFRIKKILSTVLVMALSLLGLVAPVFQSHAQSSGSHGLAIGSLVIHVVALSLWVGGIFALTVLNPADRPIAVPRFSQLALWAAIAVVASGSVNALTRLNFKEAWSSTYAYIVMAKIALVLVLLTISYLQRRNLANRDRIGWPILTRLIFIEALIMAFTVAMGAWLSTHHPPERVGASEFDPQIAISGISTPAEPTFARIIFGYEPDGLMIGLLIIAVALYVKGVVVLTRRGDKWPVGRTIAFALGVSAIDFATSGGLGLYAQFSFSYHMIAHMVLGMIAPIGIVLGAPITLALRTLPQARQSSERGVRGTLLTALHSKLAVIFTNPITALALFDGSLFVLYFTDLFGSMMQSHEGHLLMNIHFILTGVLFFHVVLGIDPNPRRIPHLVRIVIVLAAMSIHAFFSVALMSSTTLIDKGYFASLKTPWLNDFLADQRLGGSVGWAMGEIPILLALVVTFISWVKDDSREARRIDRNAARAAAMGMPDDLAQYNLYLQELDKRDRKEP